MAGGGGGGSNQQTALRLLNETELMESLMSINLGVGKGTTPPVGNMRSATEIVSGGNSIAHRPSDVLSLPAIIDR